MRPSLILLIPALALTPPGAAQQAPPPPTPPESPAIPEPPPPTAVESLRAEAERLRPLVADDSVRAFLDATRGLPMIGTRTLFRSRDRSRAYTEAEAALLTDEQRAALEPLECDARFYYYTGYGSPLVYARPLDIVARHWRTGAEQDGIEPARLFEGKRILDFGYGTIGHLRLLASLGADAHGVEVQPLFRALYSFPGDQGEIPGVAGAPSGHITLHDGRWPADEELRAAVGSGYDLFISKNVLKRGYIHPAREVDERFLVHLGVDDETFCRAVFDALKPGGLALIYNISPAQTPSDQPYLPHADGECPFPHDLLEQTGFEVVALDTTDDEAIHAYWRALGYDQGKPAPELAKDLFTWYTLVRKPE